MTRTLIVNADDLGRTAGINRGIIEAHRRGIVTSATLMVAYPAAVEAAALAAEHPGLGIGLHLALTGGPSILAPDLIPSLMDASERLPAKPERLQGSLADLMAEARAQLARFREIMGRDPTHFDSHHHSHRRPEVTEVIVALGRETGRPVRNASPDVGERLRREGIVTTDAFVESFFGEEATLGTLRRVVDGLGQGSTEIMCHPAIVDEELRTTSSYAAAREQELAVLTHPEARKAVEDAGVRLITFAQL